MQKSKIVLLAAGSFNPPTYGHLRMLEDAKSSLELSGNTVIEGFMSPVSDGYGKTTLISAVHRLAMIKAAVEDSSWIRADEWECSQAEWTTTLNVLKHHQKEVKKRHGKNVKTMLLVGGDVVETFDKFNDDGSPVWNQEDIKELVSIGLVVQPRPGSNPQKVLDSLDFLGDSQNIHIVSNQLGSNAISSTKLRAAIKEHRSISYTTPDAVIEYISKNKLYE